MAECFIEAKGNDDWHSASKSFAVWVSTAGEIGDFGWSQGDPVFLPDGTMLLRFDIPAHHGDKAQLFERWAKSAGRIYGVARGTSIAFPHDPELRVELPVKPEVPLPPWLR